MSGLRLKCCGLKQLNCGLPKRIRPHCCAKNLLRCCGKKRRPMSGLSSKSCGWSFQGRFSLRLRFYPAEKPKMSGLQLQQMMSGLQL